MRQNRKCRTTRDIFYMTYHEQRRQAEELLRRNYTVSQIAKELGLQTRTVQRWAKELREGKPESKATEPPIIKTVVVEPTNQTSKLSEPTLLGYGGTFENWQKDYNQLSNELRKMHRSLRIEMEKRLQAELQGDATSKSIHTLSLAVSRHAQEELRALTQGRTDVLTFTQACALVQASGYLISKNEGLNADITKQLPDTEDGSENPEEHRTS